MRIIRSNQETSINKRLENWIIDQSIIWDWSAKNILEQNDISKRYEALLIEKARCIREHVKLSKELFLECYLTIEHLINRISIQVLNWESLLIRMQKLINENQSIRLEIDHLKMYECKTYSLLKDADVSSKNSKLKSRAFVSYLIDYNSTNIFRVWNFEKESVNDYRDVIFDASELYDIYNKSDLLVTLAKKSQIELENERRTMKISISQAIELNNENDEWLEISIKNRLILESKKFVESKSSDQQAINKQATNQAIDKQSINDLIQLLIDFKTFKLLQSFSKIESFKKIIVFDSFVVEYSSLSKSSSSSSQSESFDKRSLKRERSDVDSSRSSIESRNEIIAMNLANRIEKMKKRHQTKRNVASTDVDQANIVNEKRVKFVSSKYFRFDYAQLTWIEKK